MPSGARVAARNALDSESRPGICWRRSGSLVNRTGMIEFIPAVTGIDHIGGLEIMKKWLLDRRKLFQMRDELSAEIVPKGVLVMGISGCGKSLAIKAIASCFDLPLYRIDMVEIFSGRHGKPEAAFVAGVPSCSSRSRPRSSGSTRSRPASARRRRRASSAASSASSSPGCRRRRAASSSAPPPTASTCCPRR